MIKAIIVDDMQQAQDLLLADIKTYCPQVEIIGTATGVVSAAKLLKQLDPDLVFLDIELEDGTGFDLLQILPEINFKVIFTTASDQYAIQAFRFAAIDYLLKPLDPDALMDAVNRVQVKDSREKVDVLLDHYGGKNTDNLVLHSSDEIKIVPIADVIRCESENNYTTFYFSDKTNFLVSKTLKSYERMLEGKFLRVHQSHLINLYHVKSYVKSEGGYLLMVDDSIVPVAVRKKNMVMEALERLGRS